MRDHDHCHHGSYVISGTLLALLFLTVVVFFFMLFPFFMPARSILTMRSKALLCSEFLASNPDAIPGITVTNGDSKPLPDTFCTEEYQPVCGEIDVQCIKAPCPPVQETYPNSCYAKKAGARIVSQGACAPRIRDMVSLTSPQEGSKITSPVTLKGMAFGGWFFEGSFPVQITDASGTLLGEGPAKTAEDWASAALADQKVAFTAKITFKKPTTKQGFIVLKQDNPSGLPENDHEMKIPVNF
jgi:hypothetical protein